MEPVTTTIITGVMSVIMPYVTRGAKDFINMAGDVAYNKAKLFMEKLKARLAGDEEATNNLNLLEKKPQRYENVVESILQEKLNEDKDLAAELEKLLHDFGPELSIIQKMKVGRGVTGLEADEVTGGRVSIEQHIEQAENVIGTRIKRIGR